MFSIGPGELVVLILLGVGIFGRRTLKRTLRGVRRWRAADWIVLVLSVTVAILAFRVVRPGSTKFLLELASLALVAAWIGRRTDT